MKRTATVLLLITLLSASFALSSCNLLDRSAQKVLDAPVPELDLELAKSNLEENGYFPTLVENTKISDQGSKRILEVLDFKEYHLPYKILVITEYENEELAKINYEMLLKQREERLKSAEALMEYYQLVLDEYTDHAEKLIEESGVIMEGEVQTYEEETRVLLDAAKESYEAAKKMFVGRDGCYVWHGYKELIEATHGEQK